MVLDVITEPSGQALKHSPLSSWPDEDRKHSRMEELDYNSASVLDDDKHCISLPEGSSVQFHGGSNSPRTHGPVCEQRPASTDVHASQGITVFYFLN